VKMPGFTAEVSLRREDNSYRLIETANELRNQKGISPQLPRILDCFCFRSFRYCCCRGADGNYVCGASQSA
jgi:hypothetical protein